MAIKRLAAIFWTHGNSKFGEGRNGEEEQAQNVNSGSQAISLQASAPYLSSIGYPRVRWENASESWPTPSINSWSEFGLAGLVYRSFSILPIREACCYHWAVRPAARSRLELLPDTSKVESTRSRKEIASETHVPQNSPNYQMLPENWDTIMTDVTY